MSQFFRKGGITLNDTEWIQDFADRRLQYGVSQTKLAVMAGISREHLSRIESGKVAVTEEMKVKLLEALEKFNPEAPLLPCISAFLRQCPDQSSTATVRLNLLF